MQELIGPTSFSCPQCCARDEVKHPAPKTVKCWTAKCGGVMERYVPGFTPPLYAGRDTTAEEKAAMDRSTAASPVVSGLLL